MRRKHKGPRQILVMLLALERAAICAFVNLIIFGANNRSDDRGLVSLRYIFEESPGSGGQAAR